MWKSLLKKSLMENFIFLCNVETQIYFAVIIISVVIIVLITVTVGTMFMVVAAALLYFIIFISSVNHNCTMKNSDW